jgi:hypothetical protein
MIAPTLLPQMTPQAGRRSAPAGARSDCQAYIAVVRCGAGRGIAAVALLDRAGDGTGEHFIPFSVREQPSQQGRDYIYAGLIAALDRLRSLGIRRLAVHVDDAQLVAELEQKMQPHRELTLAYILLGCKLNEFANAKVVLERPERLAALRAKTDSLAAPLAM